MKLHLFFYLVISITIWGCTRNTKTEIIELKPTREDNLILGKADEIIPLETTQESLMDFVTKTYIDKSNNRIVVNANMNVFLFDAKGKFIKKLKNGNGPGEVHMVVSFAGDSENNRIYVLDLGNLIHVYDFDLNFIETHQLSEPGNLDLYPIDNENLYLYSSSVGNRENYFVGIYNLEQKKVVRRFVPGNESPYPNLCMGNASNLFQLDDRLYFRSANIFGLFEFQKDTFRRIVSYDLGNRSVPENFYASYVEKRNRSGFGDDAVEKGFIPFLKGSFLFNDFLLATLYDENSSCYAIDYKNPQKVYLKDQLSDYFKLPKLKSLNRTCGIQNDFLTFACSPVDFFADNMNEKSKTVELGDAKINVNYDDNPILIVVRR